MSEAQAGSVSLEEFSWAFRYHAAGVAVVSADDGAGPIALTATSVISVSADPAVLAFSVSDRTSSSEAMSRTSHVVVHLLSVKQVELAKLCAQPGADRFSEASGWKRLPTGEPYFPQASAWFRCRVVQRVRAGQATLTVVEALEMGGSEFSRAEDPSRERTPPLVYHNRQWYGLDDNSAVLSLQPVTSSDN